MEWKGISLRDFQSFLCVAILLILCSLDGMAQNSPAIALKVNTNGVLLLSSNPTVGQFYSANGFIGGYTDANLNSYFSLSGGITNFSLAEQSALQTLVSDLKSSGLWSKAIAFYPLAGSTTNARAQNLISTNYPIKWYGFWSYASWGVRPSGMGDFADTGIYPLTAYQYTQNANYVYVGSSFGCSILADYYQPYSSVNYVMSAPKTNGEGAGDTGCTLQLHGSTSGTADSNGGYMTPFAGGNSGGAIGFTNTNTTGVWIVTQANCASTVSNSIVTPLVNRFVYLNGSTQSSSTNYQTYYPYTPSTTLSFGGLNKNFSGNITNPIDDPAAQAYQATTLPFGTVWVGYGLTSNDALNLTTIINRYQTNRQATLSTNQIIIAGDSWGTAYQGAFQSYFPNELGYLLLQNNWSQIIPTQSNVFVYSAGGTTTAYSLTNYPPTAGTNAPGGTYWLPCGVNDEDQGVSSNTTIANMKAIFGLAKADKRRTVAFTIVYYDKYTNGTSQESNRLAVNSWLRSAVTNGFVDYRRFDVSSGWFRSERY